MKIQYGHYNMAAISISSGSNANIVAAILDFMKTSNTKNVCIYIIDQHVKFRGNIPQFKTLPFSPPHYN